MWKKAYFGKKIVKNADFDKIYSFSTKNLGKMQFLAKILNFLQKFTKKMPNLAKNTDFLKKLEKLPIFALNFLNFLHIYCRHQATATLVDYSIHFCYVYYCTPMPWRTSPRASASICASIPMNAKAMSGFVPKCSLGLLAAAY